MNRIYLDSRCRGWVEAGEQAVVVSWPGGHVAMPYEVAVPDMLAVIRTAVDDLLATRPTPKELRDAKHVSRESGFKEGWEAHKREVQREQAWQDRQSGGGRRTVRDVDTGTKL